MSVAENKRVLNAGDRSGGRGLAPDLVSGLHATDPIVRKYQAGKSVANWWTCGPKP